MSPPHGLIDVHSHIVPDFYRASAIAAGISAPDGMPAWPQWSLPEHLSMMDENGISLALLSVSAPGVTFLDGQTRSEMAQKVNDIASEACEAHPERLRFLATLPLPDVNGALEELERASKLTGFVGIVMMSNTNGVYPGSHDFRPVMDALNKLQCAVFLHPNGAPGVPPRRDNVPIPGMEFLFDSARAYVSLHENGTVSQYPDIAFIGTHSGGVLPLLVDRLDLFRKGIQEMANKSMADTVKEMWFDTAGTPMPRCLPTLCEFANEEHILFGSDYCFTPSAVAGAALAGLLKDKTDWQSITTKNAKRLLHKD